MQRFLRTPPEDDPAPIAAVAAAAEKAGDLPRKRKLDQIDAIGVRDSDALSPLDYSNRWGNGIDGRDDFEFPTHQADDSVSLSGISGASSAASSGSNISHSSWAGRRGRKTHDTSSQIWSRVREADRKFQCTWCFRGFERADVWKRHEESEHCPQTEWVCMLTGPPGYNRGEEPYCVFCDQPNVSKIHLEAKHRALTCFKKPEKDRRFARKDYLLQHLKQVHHTVHGTRHNLSACIEQWRRPLDPRPPESRVWKCGFCQVNIFTWDTRARHIAKHFHDGADMTQWKGVPGYLFCTPWYMRSADFRSIT